MSEKKAFIFGSRWGNDGEPYWEKNIEKKIVFVDVYRDIPEGSYIILKDKSNFIKLGISKNCMKKALISELKIFDDAEDAKKYNIDYDEVVMYLEIDKWLEPVNLELIKKLISDSYYRIKNISQIQNYENKKLFNEFLKVNNLEELDLASSNNHENDLLNKCQELLESNYNLILTGAPGTGKTYLAKQIAAKVIFGEDKNLKGLNDDEKAKFKEQYKFVQFHPSYDYTDFVEGIRPVTENDDTYGFKRIDGIFKDFCKKAINNIIDSKKPVDVISKERIILQYLDEFSNEILETINENGVFELTETCKIYNYEQDDESINFKIVNNTNRVKIYNNELIQMYEFYSNTLENNQKYKIKDFLNYSNRKCKHETYYHNFLSAFYNKYGEQINGESINNIDEDIIKQENFVFVIDEINRGDINKILGELFYAIDLGYRGEKGKVETQYQNLVESGDVFEKGFYIPENVYIIGTMNDIDRSVESMDFAIRRRFAWQEVKPEDTADEILKNVKINSAASVLNDFNKMIADKDALGEMYQIGASYFLKLNNYINDDKINDQESIKEAYQKLWDNHLKGLIHEYVRGKKSGEEIFDKIQNKYFDLTGINCKENNEDTAE